MSSKELADNLVDNNVKITIKEHVIGIRHLFTNNKRIVLSNVQPFIPSNIIEQELSKHGIYPMSKIQKIKATAVSTPGYSHVLSFRRQMYIKPEDISRLPETLKINFEDSNFRIYLSTDKVICFLCKEEGHLQKDCQNVSPTFPHLDTVQNPLKDESPKAKFTTENEITVQHDQVQSEIMKNQMPPPITTKRAHSSNSSNSDSTKSHVNPKKTNNDALKQASKKVKTINHTIEEVREKLEPAKKFIIDNSDNTSIDFDCISNFILDTYGNSDIKTVLTSYSFDQMNLYQYLTELNKFVSNRHMKSKVTKIRNKLQWLNENEGNDMIQSDESHDSSVSDTSDTPSVKNELSEEI